MSHDLLPPPFLQAYCGPASRTCALNHFIIHLEATTFRHTPLNSPWTQAFGGFHRRYSNNSGLLRTPQRLVPPPSRRSDGGPHHRRAAPRHRAALLRGGRLPGAAPQGAGSQCEVLRPVGRAGGVSLTMHSRGYGKGCAPAQRSRPYHDVPHGPRRSPQSLMCTSQCELHRRRSSPLFHSSPSCTLPAPCNTFAHAPPPPGSFPGDVQLVQRIVSFLAAQPGGHVRLPSGTHLTPRLLQTLGLSGGGGYAAGP